VVATQVGGVPDLIDDGVNGCLVPPDDPDALAEAMVTLLTDHDRRQAMGQAGRKRVIPAFSAERLLDDIDHLYRGLLREKVGWTE